MRLKKWLNDLPVRQKLMLITVMAIISILMMGFTANYFYRTSRVLYIFINAARINNLYFRQGVEEFYTFLYTGYEENIIMSQAEISRSLAMSDAFIRSIEMADDKTLGEFGDTLYTFLDEAMGYRPEMARLTASRIRLMKLLGTQQMQDLVNIVKKISQEGNAIKMSMQNYFNAPSPYRLIQIDAAVAEMHTHYGEFAAVLDEVNDFANRLLLRFIIAITLILALLTFFLSNYISKHISLSLTTLSDTFRQISSGNIDTRIAVDSKDEVGKLAGAFVEMQNGLKEIVNKTVSIASGDYMVSFVQRSEQDKLSQALNSMTRALHKSDENNQMQNWLKTGQNQLNELLRGEHDMRELASKAIGFLSKYVEAQVGAMYLFDDESNQLVLSGSYAFTKRKEISNRFSLGEGLVGQVAFEKQMISLTQLPAGYTRIQSATGNMEPANLVIAPMVHNNKLVGVYELGLKEILDDTKLGFLELVTESIAISILSAISRNKLQSLLEKTQQQSEELQSQQEELRVTNEELAEQAEIIKKSEEQLRMQQEELLQTNTQLEEKAQLLEEQNEAISIKNEEIEIGREAMALKAQELELTSKYKSEFLANMSHEFRTPLNSMLILSKLLLENKSNNLTEKQIEYASVIDKSGHDLLNLINEILDLSKLESRKIELNPSHYSLQEVAAETLALFMETAAEKNIEFSAAVLPGTPPTIFSDKFRIELVLKNLLSNAFKFTEKNGQISLSIFKAPQGLGYKNPLLANAREVIGFEVRDNGIGIPVDKQQIIFEAFQQADGTTSRKYGGTGLGLSISRELAVILGGAITLESQVGKGSTFTLYLPSNAEHLKQYSPKDLPSEYPLAPGENMTKTDFVNTVPENAINIFDDRKTLRTSDRIILIAEDDETFAKILVDYAHEKGFKALVAARGDLALAMINKHRPHAIILDIGLPVIDGWTVLRKLKQDNDLKNIPVHIITASDDEKRGIELGAVEFLKKPISEDKIGKVFDNIITAIEKQIKHVLIIEDDQAQRETLQLLFRNHGIAPIFANTGAMGLQKLQEKQVDAIILDLMLPDMDGREVLRRIKLNKEHQSIPVIVYTAKELTENETTELMRYSNAVVAKRAQSAERLLDEITLFLKRIGDQANKNSSSSRLPMPPIEELRGKNVLLVDDDMRNIFALTKVMEENQLNVYTANDGVEALAKLNEKPNVEIILMDIMMPEMDGYETIRRIRNDARFVNLPIIALTAKAMKGDREKCLEAGATDYLPKPIDTIKLLSLMRVWLSK